MDFRLENGFDFLKIGANDYVDTSRPNIHSLSGSFTPDKVFIKSKVLWFELLTDEYYGERGFDLVLQCHEERGLFIFK